MLLRAAKTLQPKLLAKYKYTNTLVKHLNEAEEEDVGNTNRLETRRLREMLIESISFNKRSELKNWATAWPFASPHSSSSNTKSKKKRSSWALPRLQETKRLLWLPNVLNKSNSIPHILCYWLSLAFQAPPAVKAEKQENSDIRYRNAKQLCAVIREERTEELAIAAKRRRAIAVLKGGSDEELRLEMNMSTFI